MVKFNEKIEKRIIEDGKMAVGEVSRTYFVWVCSLDGSFNTKRCHYEIIWQGDAKKIGHDGKHFFAEIHIEEANERDKVTFTNLLSDLAEIEQRVWQKVDILFRLKDDCSVELTDNNIDTIIEKLYRLYDKTFFRLKMADYITLLEENYNIIFHGAPGTGKTHLAWKIAEEFIKTKQGIKSLSESERKEQIKFVQFHPSYDYTDFVEGLRPTNGNVGFKRRNGVFKELCKNAFDNPKKIYVFIIDEINRGEISKIFGELFFSIDPGYRGNEKVVETQYQNLIEDADKEGFKDGFFVPKNVYVIGTMNDIDRSVESMDFAFRRRFMFVEITAEDSQSMLYEDKAWKDNMPDTNTITKIKDVMNALNNAIWDEEKQSGIEGLSSSYHIGAAYFLKLKDGNFQNLWNYHLKGLLREYLRGIDEDGSKFKEIENQYNQAAGKKND